MTPRQAQHMRKVRNQCIDWLTHSTETIGWWQQRRWFLTTYFDGMLTKDIIGFVAYRDKEPVAYGLITRRKGKYYLSGGVAAAERGKGYGRLIFKHMMRYVHQTLSEPYVYLDVYDWNIAAKKLYKSLGFHQRRHKDGIGYMRHPMNVNKVKVRKKR